MGWEYRIFFRVDPSTPRVFAEEFGAMKAMPIEQRTDVYRPHSSSVGIKVRGRGGLEVKVRKDVDSLGFEKWKKTRIDAGSSQSANDGDVTRNGGGGDEDLDFLLESLGKPPLPVFIVVERGGIGQVTMANPEVALSKQRQQIRKEGCTLEETDIVLRFESTLTSISIAVVGAEERKVSSGEDGQRDLGAQSSSENAQEFWRSVAVEGKRKFCRAVQENLLSRVQEIVMHANSKKCESSGKEHPVVLVCGYAEFVTNRCHRFASAPAHRNSGVPLAAAAAVEEQDDCCQFGSCNCWIDLLPCGRV
mmetsp:Transcript_56160/g.112514  ORF Transcript_56160/g.112514 Transcript_56160/m.112514 type:complete len:305 (-) Transcript_56160:178-1092(-)